MADQVLLQGQRSGYGVQFHPQTKGEKMAPGPQRGQLLLEVLLLLSLMLGVMYLSFTFSKLGASAYEKSNRKN